MKRNYFKPTGLLTASLIAAALGTGSVQAQTLVTQTVSFSGSTTTFTLPYCVTTLTIEAYGAGGGSGQSNTNPGLGGVARGVLTSTPGTVLYINVGGQGSLTAGGFNGGGNGGVSLTSSGAGGGGASDVRVGSNSLSARILVAAGGGGSGGNGYGGPYGAYGGNGGGGSVFSTGSGVGGGGASGCASGGNGGDSGGSAGSYGSGGGGGGMSSGGGGGGQPSASTGGYGCNGALGQGGDGGGNSYICGGASGGQNGGGGGGGGYYGGGGGMTGTGGCNGGGGGGSSYANSSIFSNISYISGAVSGHGMVTITYTSNGANVVAASNTLSICNGQSVTLSASNVSSYTWAPVGSFPGSNATSVTVSPSSTTTYTVGGTAGTCVSYGILTVTVSPGAPTMTITPNTSTVCLGMPVTLTVSGAYSYTWASSQVTNVITYTPQATTAYTVSGSNPCGTSSTMTTISLVPLPVPLTANPATVCASNPAVLTATGATGYTWSPGPMTGSMVSVSPASTTIYTVSAYNGTCSGSNTIAVTTKPNPTLTIAGTATRICTGESVTMTVSGADTYTWNPSTFTGTTIVASPTAASAYQVSGTNSVSCTTGAVHVVLVDLPPTLSGNLSSTLTCPNNTITLVASGAGSYTWSHGPMTNSTVVSSPVSTVFVVTGMGTSNTCTATRSYSVNVANPVLGVSASTAVCYGTPLTLTAGPGTGFSWLPGGSGFPTLNLTATASVVYTVNATVNSSGINCPASGIIQVTVNPNPTVNVTAPSTVICRANPLVITASGASTYSWSVPGAGTGASITFSNNSTVTHNIFATGTDVNGCKGTGSIQVKVNSCTGLAGNGAPAMFNVYPNPSNGEFTIRSSEAMELSIVNAIGQVVRNLKLDESGNYTARVSDLANGVYFISGDQAHDVTYRIVVSK